MFAQFLSKTNISYLEKECMSEGKLLIKPYSFYKQYPFNDVLVFMHTHGIYVLPTQELIDWLRENIVGKAIEIGAGIGAIGRVLGIPITDNKMQEWPEVKKFYLEAGQPLIKYPADVEELDYLAAIEKYKPDTVVGAFITHKWNGKTGNPHGVDALKIKCKYIMVGNLITHQDNPLLKQCEKLYFEWLITRAVDQLKNRIFIV